MGNGVAKHQKGITPVFVQPIQQAFQRDENQQVRSFQDYETRQSKTKASSSIFKPNAKPTWTCKLPVMGQGVVTLNIVRNTQFCMVVRKPRSQNWISLDIHKDGAFFTMHHGRGTTVFATMNNSKAGFLTDTFVTYWLSYDRNNLTVKYGKGHVMEEAVLLKYNFLGGKEVKEQSKIRQSLYEFFNPEQEAFVELHDENDPEILVVKYDNYIKSCNYEGRVIQSAFDLDIQILLNVEKNVDLLKSPLVSNRPACILDSARSNLLALDKDISLCSASLPPAAKELYENIKMFQLNYPERLDNILLADAIRYSIETKGCLLYNKLKEKSTTFDRKADPRKTYLRITLGKSYNTSPGIPYVLEIWPAKHYSPVHSHGNANAAIKVLHGSIHARIFNKLAKTLDGRERKPELLKEFDAKEGDMTWMDRNWYQTHQLENITNDFCATLQCYKYDEIDGLHWPYFSYINDSQRIAEFLPNTDFTFSEMYEKTIEEFKAAKNIK